MFVDIALELKTPLSKICTAEMTKNDAFKILLTHPNFLHTPSTSKLA